MNALMPASYPGRRRSRPVADAPALDGSEVAKAWLVELVAIAPLERAARLPGPRFAEDAPRLCAAVVAALASDAALDDLEPGGPLAPLAAGAGHLAAAPGPLETVAALEALRTVMWSALLAAVDRPVPSQIGDLADRLGTVISLLTTAALETPHPLGPTRPGDRGPLGAVLREARPSDVRPDPAPRVEHHPTSDTPPPPAGEERSPRDFSRGPSAEERRRPWETRDVVEDRRRSSETSEPVVDDRPTRPDGLAASVADRRKSPGEALAEIEAALREAAHAADPLAEAAARLRALGHEPATHDHFGGAATLPERAAPIEEPRIRRLVHIEDATDFASGRVTPWAASIERRLARHRGDGLPFAVLCLELVDTDRLISADMDRDVVETLEQAEAAILAQLRPADALIRERPGRYWLTTPDTDQADGRALAHRIASAVEDLPPHRGAPIQLAIGVTSCPGDASDAPTLESRAEEALFAARAGGVRVAGPPAT